MNNFTISFLFHGQLFSAEVKKKKHESAIIYAVDLNHAYLQTMFRTSKLVLIEHVVNSFEGNCAITVSQTVYYCHRQKKDAEFEAVIWKAVHDVLSATKLIQRKELPVPVYAF